MVFLELKRNSRVTTGNSGFLLCWPREVQSSIRVARESWGLLSSHCRAKDTSSGLVFSYPMVLSRGLRDFGVALQTHPGSYCPCLVVQCNLSAGVCVFLCICVDFLSFVRISCCLFLQMVRMENKTRQLLPVTLLS